MKSVVLFIVSIIFVRDSVANYSSTFTDFSKCKVHYSIQEKKYTVFYRIEDLENLEKDNRTILDFHFSILGISDAHILLAPSNQVFFTDPVYEIVIGAGGNTFSDIRRHQKSDVRATIRAKGLLSAVDIRSFWIRIFKDGTIDVGKEGEELGFLSWKDTDLLPVEVFSFSIWGNVEAKWFFDCPRGNKSTNSEEIEVVLTDLEKLRKHLLVGYDPYVRPVEDEDTTTIIIFRFYSYFITLDEKKSVLNMKGLVILEWVDEKLAWNPEDYGNIEYLHMYHGEIWKPYILVTNGVNPQDEGAFNSRLLVVFSNGTVRWKATFNSNTFCDLSSLYHWPNDVHTCSIDFTLWNHIGSQYLIYDNANSGVISKNYGNGWAILETTALEMNPEQNSSLTELPMLSVVVKVRRISDLYGKSIFTPFFVTSTLMLLSFWVSPFGYLKMTLASLQLILLCMILIGIAMCLPGHSSQVPFLVYLYSSAILGNMVTVLIGVIVINLARTEQMYGPPHCITKILNFKAVQIMLLLPEGEVGTIYGKLDREVTFKKASVQEMWIRLGTAIDRITFFIFLCLTTSSLFAKY